MSKNLIIFLIILKVFTAVVIQALQIFVLFFNSEVRIGIFYYPQLFKQN